MFEKFKRLKISEIVFIAVISAAMGVAWWGYTFFYDLIEPFLKPFGIENLLTGVWFMGAIFFPYIIRKPGSALLGEVIAAFVQGFIARWGISSLAYGLAQGLPVEIFFLILGYKRWNLGYLCIGGAISALSSFILSFFWYQYFKMNLSYNLIQIGCFIVTGVVLAGILSKLLADGLKKTGVLNQFNIVRDELE
jgi:energy-coupling factor transport system permease protein